MSRHFTCQILMQYIASLNGNHLQMKKAKKYDVAWRYGGASSNKFCVCLEKYSNANFSYIKGNRKYVISQSYILNIWYKGFLRGRNSELDDGRPGRRRIISDNLVKKISNVMDFPTVSLAE